MRFPAPAVVFATAALLVGAAATPAPPEDPVAVPAAEPTEPAAAAEPATPSDYTTQSLQPPMVGEYDSATAPPPMYASPPGDAGGLRQCVGADGVPIFTDRRCEDLQATEQRPPATLSGSVVPPGLLRVRSCARNQDDLLAGVRAALESHDANRLADFYHWTGMGTTEGYRLMERLDAFSARPVVDVQLVRSADPEAEFYSDLYFDEPPPMALWPEEADDEAPPSIDAPAPRPRKPRLASMLRVDQMRSDTDAASTVTYFRLLTNAGCWWMRF